MIIYFSATGNSRHVANELAESGEKLVSIPEAIDNHDYDIFLMSGEKLGIITPTYNWTIPSVVSEYLERLVIHHAEKPYTYYVGTFGTTTGAAAKMADKYMKKLGCPFDAFYDVKMPDTWTPIYDLSDKDKVREINKSADLQIAEIKRLIEERTVGKHMHITMPYAAGCVGRWIYDSHTRNTDNLTLEDTCVGCGLCARKCPVHAIEMKDKRPVWVKDKCAMCLGCLHRCPKTAISCGPNTAKHGRYEWREP